MKNFLKAKITNIKDKKTLILLVIIVILTFFVRGYKFNDWLVFRADQARDAHHAKEAIDNGPGSLQLLGPRMGAAVYLEGDANSRGDAPELGPIYYYFQYFSALIFGGAYPSVLAFPDFILSLLAIPLFYFLLRQLFSKKISLTSTIVFASSFILLEYSRFAWNTNQLVFWEILLVLSLIKVVKEKDRKKAGLWLLTAALGLGILSQLHFIALFGFGTISFIFLLLYRPQNISWKFWIGAIGTLIFIYIPFIVSDIKNNGDNTKRLIGVISTEKIDTEEETGDENEDEVSESKIIKTLENHGKYYSMILSSINQYEVKSIVVWGVIGVLFSLALIIFLITKFKKKWLISLPRSHPLTVIVLIWFIVFFILYFNILPRIGRRARYWLLIAPLSFLFLAYWLAFIDNFKHKIIKNSIIFFATIILIFSNLSAVLVFYNSLNKGLEECAWGRKNTLDDPYKTMFVLGSMRDSSFYMVEKSKENTGEVCFFINEYQNKLAYDYIFNFYHPEVIFENTSSGNEDFICDFFVVAKTKHGERGIKEYADDYNVKDKREFKALTVWQLEPKVKNDNRKEIKIEPEERETEKALYWKDIF